eukprot:Blabericola_migrator_1__375@NODE_1093_length_5463_cov_81_535211_g748_i0_p1_GENE_NODE_1093_length_5463_cov_81_535211_g748_i0NODE_1093_length_5463_cov_81_535211_g748_i0_p1_ORF_typecomplete_len431_score56_58Nucleoside_tran/PF01733_18/5_8e02Nucleoside_tran/PF01733_18/4_8e45DUF3412/PF11892_8/3_5DUF3412/PF11892_8/2_4e02_NODE_1093_length_5463_cov_81_535211_g748_i020113303
MMTQHSSVMADEAFARSEYVDDEKIVDPNDAPVMILTRKQDFLCCCVFVVMGTAELYYWNSVLNVLYNIQADIYPEHPSMTNTLNAVNNLGCIFVAAINIWTGAMHQKLAVAAGFIMAVMHIVTAMVVQWSTGTTGVVLLHICNVVAGMTNGAFQSNSYGLAASMPRVFSGYVSAGNGICGVVTFLVWMLFSEAVYKPWNNITREESAVLTKKANWWLMGIGFVLMSFSSLSYMYLLRQPFVEARLEAAKRAIKEENSNPEAPSYLELLKVSWKMVFTAFFCLFITLFIFPNPGPLKWADSRVGTNVVTGMFQVGDLIGRYLPTLIPIALIAPTALFYATLSRVAFVVLFFLCYKFPANEVWGSLSVHIILMLLLAITNGWYASCSLIHAPESLTTKTKWRSRVSAMALVGVLVGIFAGLWCSKIVFIWA